MKKKKIIIIVGSVVVIWIGLIGFVTLNNKEDLGKKNNSSSVEKYLIPEQKKIIINGVITPNKSKTYYKDTLKGNEFTVNVENGNYVKKGDLLITYKNNEIIEQVKTLSYQIEDMKKEKYNSMDNIDKSVLQEEINKISREIKTLSKKQYSYVYAPFSGSIFINNQGNSEESQEILKLNSTDFYVKATCSEKEHVNLDKNLEAEILVLPTNEKIYGKITYISNEPENQLVEGDSSSSTSNYSLNITLDNQTDLVNGYHAQISVKLSSKDIEVPKESIIKEENKNYVYVVKNGVVKKQGVVVSEINSKSVLIKSGLNEKDEIVKNPSTDMKEGQEIE